MAPGAVGVWVEEGREEGDKQLVQNAKIFGPRFSLSFRADFVWRSDWALAALSQHVSWKLTGVHILWGSAWLHLLYTSEKASS